MSKFTQVKTAYRYRFYPTPEQEQFLNRVVGCVRWTYNMGLFTRQAKWKAEKKSISYVDLAAMLPQWKKKHEWLGEVPAVCLQQALRNLDRAYTNFFEKRARFPKAKKKHKNTNSAKYPGTAFKYEDGEITIAKMKTPLDIVWHRPLPSKPSSVTIMREPSGQWYISCQIELMAEHYQKTVQTVGVDLGLTDVVVTSHFEKTGNPRHLKKRAKKLAKAQAALARKQKGSKNRAKAGKKVARLHADVKHARRDFLHKLSSKLVRENQVITMEDLNIKGLARGRNAKSVNDVGWGMLKGFIKYKCEWYGRRLVLVDRFFPSTQRCSACEAITGPKGDCKVREWICSECGVIHDRDFNAAINLDAAGTAVEPTDDSSFVRIACGGEIRPVTTRKQANTPKRASRGKKPRKTKETGNPESDLREATSIVTPLAA